MRIVIAGAGEVGSHLAKMLSDENHDIIIIDTDEKKLLSLDSYNLLTIVGSPISFKTQKYANVPQADIFIAVTPFETRNLIACNIAKKLGARKTVARIDNFEYMCKENQAYFSNLGIDTLIYPEYLAAQEMQTAIRHTWARNWFELMDGELIVIGVKLRANAQIVGMRLRDLGFISGVMHVSAIRRNRETIIPKGDDFIQENDILYLATTRNCVNQVMIICGKEQIDVQKILIVGGSPIAIQLAYLVGHDYKVKIIEPDLERCKVLAEKLPDCNIVHGTATDSEILEEEGISDYDMFISVTNSSESNILSCLMAKQLGLRKTIAEVENIQFIPEAENLNIGTIINKKLLASSRIFQMMLDLDVDNPRYLALTDAEVAELVVKSGAKVTKSKIRDLKLNRDVTIAGLVRDGVGQLVTGETQLKEGDHVVIFSLSGALYKIEKLFS